MVTRREFLQTSALAAVALALPLADSQSARAATIRTRDREASLPKEAQIQFAWWGGSTRDILTEDLIKLFEKVHPGWSVTPSFAEFTNYFDEMDVRAAASDLPDVLQNGGAWVPQYADDHQLLDLTPYTKSGALDIAGFDPGQLLQGSDNGKLYALTDGGNMPAMIYNLSMIEKAGMQPPREGVTWTAFGEYCASLQKRLPNGVYALDDNSGTASGAGLLVWVRQTHRVPYTKKGLLNYTTKDVASWLQYWAKLRDAGIVVPGTTEAAAIENGTNEATPLVLNQAVFTLIWTNYISQYAPLMKDKLGMMRYPTGGQGGKLVGDFLNASQFLSASSHSKYPAVAIEFINFFMNNPHAIKILGVERGVPAAVRNQQVVLSSPRLSTYDKQQVSFMSKYGPLTRPLGQVPANSGPLSTYIQNAAQAVALGTSSVADAAEQYISQSETALSGGA